MIELRIPLRTSFSGYYLEMLLVNLKGFWIYFSNFRIVSRVLHFVRRVERG